MADCDKRPLDSLIPFSGDVRCSCVFDFTRENEIIHAYTAQEQAEIAGTSIHYWVQDRVNTKLDPLYNEPIERVWVGPYQIKVAVKWPDDTFEVREDGARKLWTAQVTIPRITMEKVQMVSVPEEGDVLRIWDLPFFEAVAQGVNRDTPKAGFYFDVIRAAPDGVPLSNGLFTRYILDIKRRTEFVPERRLYNET